MASNSKLALSRDGFLWLDNHFVGGLGSRSAEGGLLNFGPAYFLPSFDIGIKTGDVFFPNGHSATVLGELLLVCWVGDDCRFEGLLRGEFTKFPLFPISAGSPTDYQ